MKIIVASEHAGFELKKKVVQWLRENGYEAEEAGAESTEPVSYSPIAEEATLKTVSQEYQFGILICGTGIGMCMASGKVPGSRAALCCNAYMARMARRHNNANILVLGSRVIGTDHALNIVETFLNTSFEGGRHEARLEDLRKLEQKYLK